MAWGAQQKGVDRNMAQEQRLKEVELFREEKMEKRQNCLHLAKGQRGRGQLIFDVPSEQEKVEKVKVKKMRT